MEMTTKDMVMKKLLDAQEMVRDYEMFSKQTDDSELVETFKTFAEESGMQASRLQAILDRQQHLK